MLNLLHRTCKDISDGVRSRLEYASPVWSPFTKRNITALEQVKRKATTFIVGRGLSYNEHLVKLNLIPLVYRREISDLVFFYRCLKDTYVIDIFQYISFRSCTRSIRSVDHLSLNIPFCRTEAFRNSYFVRICRLWNELPLNIRESETLAVFRHKLILFYCEKSYTWCIV